MTKLISGVVAAAALVFAGSASAADMPLKAPPPVAPAFTWTGWYIGVNAGGGWGVTDPNFNIDDSLGRYFTFGASQTANIVAVTGAGNGKIDNNTVTGGAQIGHNWQSGNIVYGFEADFDYFNPKGSSTGNGVLPPPAATGTGAPVTFTITNSTGGDWLSTQRVRLGIAHDNLLLYGTVGSAIAQVNFSGTYADNTTCPPQNSCALRSNFSRSATEFGIAVGAGAEYALSRNWSIRGEYLYVQLNSLNGSTVAMPTAGLIPAACPPSGGGFCSVFKYDAGIREQIARAAINFRF